MGELVRFEVGPGESVVVETDMDAVGVERVARRDADGVVSASTRLQEAVAQVKPAIMTVLSTLRDLAPDEHEVEFGIKLSAEAGVVIARTAVEGHFTVKMTWRKAAGTAGE